MLARTPWQFVTGASSSSNSKFVRARPLGCKCSGLAYLDLFFVCKLFKQICHCPCLKHTCLQPCSYMYSELAYVACRKQFPCVANLCSLNASKVATATCARKVLPLYMQLQEAVMRSSVAVKSEMHDYCQHL